MSKTKRLLISMLTLLCCTGVWATGELNGLFTINASGDKVQFSQGNLQYFCSTTAPEWRFAGHQYDYVAFDISAYAANSEKWIDLFAHGTSGYDNGQTNYQPYVVGAGANTYYQGNLTGNADWGYNAISNGGNTENCGWRTLTIAEWLYLFESRSNAASKYGQASINGVNGMILLPDNWTLPDGLSFISGNHSWATNTYTIDQWTQMETAGAVFLPASGSCNSTGIPPESAQNQLGIYRASTSGNYIHFRQNDFGSGSYYQYGDAVRLVKNYELQQDGESNYLIGSADDWKLFATLVQTTPTANAKMTADIDLGDDLTMVGSTSGNSYQGTFDGQGHTLTVNYNSTIHGIAPFQHVGAATISNLHVDGSIVTTGCGAGGIVSKISGNLKVSRCWVSATLQTVSSGGNRGTIGGIVSYCEEANCSIVIEDCVFTGVIVNTEMCGGLMSHLWNGSSSVTMRRCLNVGTNTGANAYNYTFIRDTGAGTGTRNLETSTLFYKTVFGNAQGTQADATTLSDGTVTTALNDERAEEVWVQDLVTNQPMLKLFATKAYTVPSSGIGTFSAAAKFTVPDGLTAHYCKTYDSENHTIGVVDIDGAVPANTGVVLKGTPGQTYTLTGTNSTAATVTDNALVAVTEATHVDPITGDYTNFMMSGGKFIKIEESSDPEVKMPANRAYLQILTSVAGSRPITLSWDNDATSIQSVHDARMAANGYYNLAGQRVARPTKGLYIVNGKKVVIK